MLVSYKVLQKDGRYKLERYVLYNPYYYVTIFTYSPTYSENENLSK